MKRKRIDFTIGGIRKKQKIDDMAIYQKPVFSELVKKYPEFAMHVNEGRIDYTNPESIISLTKTILLDQFSIRFDFPNSKFLCPRVPSRLNYLQFIRKLLLISGDVPLEPKKFKEREIFGIDVGTGASAVYPLLGKSIFNWNFLATEIDPEAISISNKIVESNGKEFQKSIQIFHNQDKNVILQPNILPSSPSQFHFCMCNPPFFSDLKEGERNHPKRVCIATENELITSGGEIEFIKKMIDDSKILNRRIKWYSSLLGKSTSMNPIIEYLKSNSIQNFIVSEFQPSETSKIKRYAIAWNFFHPTPIWMQVQKGFHPQFQIIKYFKPISNLVTQMKSKISSFFHLQNTSFEYLDHPSIKLRVLKSEEIIEISIHSTPSNRFSFSIHFHSSTFSRSLITYHFQDLYDHLFQTFKKK